MPENKELHFKTFPEMGAFYDELYQKGLGFANEKNWDTKTKPVAILLGLILLFRIEIHGPKIILSRFNNGFLAFDVHDNSMVSGYPPVDDPDLVAMALFESSEALSLYK